MHYKLTVWWHKLILACGLILIPVMLFSQIQSKPFPPDAFNSISLKNEVAEQPLKINLENIIIIDSRKDSSNIGYSIEKAKHYQKTKQYQLNKGFIKGLHDWFSNYLQLNPNSTNTGTLLINIRKLRVSDEAITTRLFNGTPGLYSNGWVRGTIIKIEYYLQNDSFFIPLYRFDSIVHFEGKMNKYADKHIATYITESLKISLQKLFLISDNISQPKKKILLQDIIAVNKRENNIPLYADSSLKKGIYKTFEDFKMNAIVFPDFEFRKGKLGDIVYVKENGSEYPLRNVWGFCDGKNYYINSCDKYSKLIRTGETFYFEGIKNLSLNSNMASEMIGNEAANVASNYSGSQVSPSSSPQFNYALTLKYYQLDMENGNIY